VNSGQVRIKALKSEWSVSVKKVSKVSLGVMSVFGLALVAKSALVDFKATAAAYLYGYPLVIMEETRKASEKNHAPNVLLHSQTFPGADFRLVVRPNQDTLYSPSWFDLKESPLVISMPDTGDRYYVLPFMDAWTNVFARSGTSTTGNGKKEIALVGPDYDGELPSGLTEIIRSPTNMVWMIGRVQTNSAEDVANVSQLQEQMALTPLSDWVAGVRNRGIVRDMSATEDVDPMIVVENMDAQTFFAQLNRLMLEQPALAADAAELAKFAHLNIGTGAEFKLDELGWLPSRLLDVALAVTRNRVTEALEGDRFNAEGWRVMRSGIGVYGTNYQTRAGIAKAGLGALPAEEASYPGAWQTPDGEALDGSKFNYRLHFAANELPPVDAFWSLTLYDTDGFMKSNEIDRHSIGDRSNIQFNDDGSLDLFIQHEKPAVAISNWLPAPQEPFNVLLRLYNPGPSFMKNQWRLPPLEKLRSL